MNRSPSLFHPRTSIRAHLFALTCCITPFCAQAEDIDYVAKLSTDPKLAAALGLDKLNDAEKGAWNRVIVAAFAAGREAAGQTPVVAQTVPAPTPEVWSGRAWQTKADLEGEDVITLRNGAVFEATGLVGFGLGRDALVIQEGGRWTLWIEGKREYSGTLLRRPQGGTPINFKRTTVDSVSSDGAILKTADGNVYEVDVLGRLSTSLWLAGTGLLVLADGTIVNADSPMGEKARAKKLR